MKKLLTQFVFTLGLSSVVCAQSALEKAAFKDIKLLAPEIAVTGVPSPVEPVRMMDKPSVSRTPTKEYDNCYYDGDDFYVVYQGTKYRATADDDSGTAIVSCSDKVSAMYDGDDLIVFNPRTKNFKTIFADDNASTARLSAAGSLAVFYDGDDLILYNADTDSFETKSVDDNASTAEVIASPAAVLAWDGDDLYGYCAASRRWITSSGPEDNYSASAQIAPNGRGVGMIINRENYSLNPDNCQITQTSEPIGLSCSYDGDDFLIKYENRDYSYPADDNFAKASISCGVNTAIMYDGDDMIVFDGPRHAFYTNTADDLSSFSATIAGNGGALAYDGDDLFGYCGNGRWVTKYVDDNAPAIPSGSSASTTLAMRIGSELYRFNPASCSMQ
ncbi:MAG: hypothetical protein WCW52_05020 [Elusimicrobiales bacterium]|jgi:hypothetical protein